MPTRTAPVPAPRDRHQPAHPLDDLIEAGTPDRPVLAEAGMLAKMMR